MQRWTFERFTPFGTLPTVIPRWPTVSQRRHLPPASIIIVATWKIIVQCVLPSTVLTIGSIRRVRTFCPRFLEVPGDTESSENRVIDSSGSGYNDCSCLFSFSLSSLSLFLSRCFSSLLLMVNQRKERDDYAFRFSRRTEFSRVFLFFLSFLFFSNLRPLKMWGLSIRTERNTMERYKYFATYDGLSNVQV